MPVLYFCSKDHIHKVYYTHKKSNDNYGDEKWINVYMNKRQLRFYAVKMLLKANSTFDPVAHVVSALNHDVIILRSENIFDTYQDAELALKAKLIKDIID